MSRVREMTSTAVDEALHGDRAVNDLYGPLQNRVRMRISGNYAAAAEAIQPGLSAARSTVSRAFIEAARPSSAPRDLSG